MSAYNNVLPQILVEVFQVGQTPWGKADVLHVVNIQHR